MKYFDSIYRLFGKKTKPKIDEFDIQYGFLLKKNVKEKQSNEVKSYYFQNHQACQQ